VFVVVPGYDRTLEWGPCLPPGVSANVGETVTVMMTNRGRPWIQNGNGNGDGGGRGGDVGDIKTTARATAPVGWLLCHGQAIDRIEYAALFDAINVYYGQGDGATTFNVPDLRDRMALGASARRPLGYQGGAEEVALGVSEMPSHSHAGVTSGADRALEHAHGGTTNAADRDLNHTHNGRTEQPDWNGHTGFNVYASGGPDWWIAITVNGTFVGGDGMKYIDYGHTHAFNSGWMDRAIDHLHTFTTAGIDRSLDHLHGVHAEGGGGSHQNMSPFTAVNYVIKF
jgi:microcystin-dependent protein